MAFQTSSLRLISVSRGSKPCRKKSREEQVCRRGEGKGRLPSLWALPSHAPLVLSYLNCRHMISILSLEFFGDPELTNITLFPKIGQLSAPD